MLTVANENTRKHVIDRTTVYTAVYGRKQTVNYGIIPYRNRNRKPSLKVLDGYGYGPRITDPYDAIVRCTVTSPTFKWGLIIGYETSSYRINRLKESISK